MVFLMLLMLLVAATFSSGCIRMVQKGMGPDLAGDGAPENSTGMNDPSAFAGSSSGIRQHPPVVEMTPLKSDIVTAVTPFITPDPYPVLHGTRINATPLENPLDRNPEFEKDYRFGGNATALLVNVAEAPLYIVYEVTPDYDCTKTPESCRGTAKKPVNRPYLTITVRDNQTNEIVAEDGYGREYSSDIGHYEFVGTAKNLDGSTATIRSTPGPRNIVIYRTGTFHITMEGNHLSAEVKILTGATPSRLEVSTDPGLTPVPVETKEGLPPGWG